MVKQNRAGQIEFRLYRPDARWASVVGDFNNWDESSLPMSRTGTGHWACRLKLPDGVYQFRYLIDGEWYVDHDECDIKKVSSDCSAVLVVKRTNS